MDANLNDMVKHIVNDDDDNAHLAFHGYVKEKMRAMIAAGQTTAPAVNTAEPEPDKD